MTVGILGLSFKPNTNDLREAPALSIAQELMEQGSQRFSAYDPAALEEALEDLAPAHALSRYAYETARDADALVLMTEWNEFRNLDFAKLKSLMRRPLLVDLRNVYESSRVTPSVFVTSPSGVHPKSRTIAGLNWVSRGGSSFSCLFGLGLIPHSVQHFQHTRLQAVIGFRQMR